MLKWYYDFWFFFSMIVELLDWLCYRLDYLTKLKPGSIVEGWIISWIDRVLDNVLFMLQNVRQKFANFIVATSKASIIFASYKYLWTRDPNVNAKKLIKHQILMLK